MEVDMIQYRAKEGCYYDTGTVVTILFKFDEKYAMCRGLRNGFIEDRKCKLEDMTVHEEDIEWKK